jgi:hypothetical protein
MFEMMFEFGNTVGAQLAVEIAVEDGTAKITTHAYSSLWLEFTSPRGPACPKPHSSNDDSYVKTG